MGNFRVGGEDRPNGVVLTDPRSSELAIIEAGEMVRANERQSDVDAGEERVS